jgi:hypothetical protein
MKEKLDKLFNEALNDFDFFTTRKVMEFLDWKWYGSSDYPTIEEMINMCKELYGSALFYFLKKEVKSSVCSGGFSITVSNNYVGIEFVIERSQKYEEE